MPKPQGGRKAGTFIAVSDSPDPCRTPPSNAAVPYMIMAKLDDSLAVSPDVLFDGFPAVLVDGSSIASVTGDEAGSGGGVKSGCNEGEVKFTGGDSRFWVNGKQVVRDGDPVSLNKGNTTGQVICLMPPAPADGAHVDSRPGSPVDEPGQGHEGVGFMGVEHG